MRNTFEKAGNFVKKLIGIAPASFIGDPDKSCMADYYKLGNNYTKRIVEAGGIPFGLAPADNLLTEDALERCDSFLVQGGAEFYPYHFQIIHHAVTHGKKYLGICLGQQLIYVYLELRRRVEARGYSGDLVRAICEYLDEQGPGFSVQKRISGHRSKSAPRGMEDETKHDVNIVPGTHIYIEKDSKLDKIKELHDKAWKEFIMHKAYDMDAKKAEKHMKRKVNYLRNLYNRTISEELAEVKKQIFGEF